MTEAICLFMVRRRARADRLLLSSRIWRMGWRHSMGQWERGSILRVYVMSVVSGELRVVSEKEVNEESQ